MSIHCYAPGHHPLTHRPYRHVSRSTARRWILAGTYEPVPGWERAIRRLTARRPPVRASKGYVPDRWPPVELPGIHFEEPSSAAWRETHRRVSFPSRVDSIS